MNLPLALDLQLSWPLLYRWNSEENLSGLNINVQNSADKKSLDNCDWNNCNISLLASLLAKIKGFNLVSLEGNKDNEVNAVINITNNRVVDFKKTLKQTFENFTGKLHNSTKLEFEDIPAKTYHIADGLTVFEIINILNKRINNFKDKAGQKVFTAFDLVKISSGETFNHQSDLDLHLKCKKYNDSTLQKIRSKLNAFARAYRISIS